MLIAFQKGGANAPQSACWENDLKYRDTDILRALIVDDEALIRSSIRRCLSERADVNIVGECESGMQAISAIRGLRPDLVLLDVQMHDGTGLEVVEQVGPDQMPVVIFVTAYDEYAVKAFEWNAVDYLLKPFDDDRLTMSLERAKRQIHLGRGEVLAQQFRSLLEARVDRWPERLVVRTGERFDFIPVQSVDRIESANNYAQLHCGSRQYLINETITSLTERLNPSQFVRVHRGRVVNLSRVTSVHLLFSGAYELVLTTGIRISTGRQYRDRIKALLKT